jgi:hypothetical protein
MDQSFMYLTVTVMADKDAFLQFLLDFAPRPCTRYLKRFVLTIDVVKCKISHAAIISTDLTLATHKRDISLFQSDTFVA